MPLHVSAGKIKNLWRTDDAGVLHEVKNLWTDQGQVFSSGPTIEVHEVSRSGMYSRDIFHSLISLSPPQGEQWNIRIEGVFSAGGGSSYPTSRNEPVLTIGAGNSRSWGEGARASYEGVASSSNSRIGVTTNDGAREVGFVGTVTVTKP